MGYVITYERSHRKGYKIRRVGRIGWQGITAALLIMLLVILSLSPQVRGQIKSFLLPGDAKVTAAALDNMVSSIKGGEPIGDAVTAFCLEIIDSAKE